jgi:hypothetical protein
MNGYSYPYEWLFRLHDGVRYHVEVDECGGEWLVCDVGTLIGWVSEVETASVEFLVTWTPNCSISDLVTLWAAPLSCIEQHQLVMSLVVRGWVCGFNLLLPVCSTKVLWAIKLDVTHAECLRDPELQIRLLHNERGPLTWWVAVLQLCGATK